MKTCAYTLKLLGLGIVLAGTVSLHAQEYKGLKKGVNISVNLTNKKKMPPRTYFNLGLLSSLGSLEGVGLNLVSSIAHHHARGFQVAGITNVTGLDVAGLQFSGIANVTGGTTNGVTLTGLMNVSGKQTNGFAFSGLANFAGEAITGMAVSGLMNISAKDSRGLHFAGLANISGDAQRGLMLSGLINVAGGTQGGVQLGGLGNIAARTNRGLQLGGVGNIAVKNQGVQLSLSNYCAENRAVQLGMANVSNASPKGVQVGFINISADSTAHQIGCINIRPGTKVQMILSGGNLNKMGLAVRFKNGHTYTELGAGGYFLGGDRDFSVSAFYRAGVCVPLAPRLELQGDAGFYHIEALDNKDKGFPARLYALQPRLNLEYRLARRLGVYASGGYSWTRAYGHSTLFDRKATFEAGLVLF